MCHCSRWIILCELYALPILLLKRLAIKLEDAFTLTYLLLFFLVEVFYIAERFCQTCNISSLWMFVWKGLSFILSLIISTLLTKSIKKIIHNRVRLNGLWFVIHDKILSFHNWILCYHEHFYKKVKNHRKISID